MTASTEHLAIATGLSVLGETGTWDVGSVARGEPAGVRTDRVLVDIAVAYRPVPRIELVAQGSASVSLADAPGVHLAGRALGDTFVRARWDVRDPDERLPWPGVGLVFGVRAPTGDVGADASALSDVAGTGLGAWELSAGVDLRRSLGSVWMLGVAVEGAARLPDESTGTDRLLGPRVTTALSLMYRPTDDLAVSLSVAEWWEGPTVLGGVNEPDSSLRRTTVSAGLTTRTEALRWTAVVAADPGFNGFGTNGVTTLRVGLLAAWVR